MAFANEQVFSAFHLYQRSGAKELGRYGRDILTLIEVSGDADKMHTTYLRVLGVLASLGTEVGRTRAIDDTSWNPRTIMAQQVFYFPQADLEATILRSRADDNELQDGVRYDRKTSSQQLGPMGEVALEYDGTAEPPVLRVIDVQGSDRDGMPYSDLPDKLLTDLQVSIIQD